jgi:hypothetical protein
VAVRPKTETSEHKQRGASAASSTRSAGVEGEMVDGGAQAQTDRHSDMTACARGSWLEARGGGLG